MLTLKPESKPRDATHSAELIALLCAGNTFITANMGMLGPLLLQLSGDFDVTLAQAGLLASFTALPWALAAPILGPLSDRFGRRRTLAASLIGLGFATCAGAAASSFVALAVVRVLSGVLASAGPTSMMAAVGDHVPPQRRASALGWVNSGFGISALGAVPAIGALGGAFGWRAAFVVTGLATVLLAVLLWLRLPSEVARERPTGSLLGPYRAVLRSGGLAPILVGNVLERCVFAIFGLYLASYLIQTYWIDLVAVAPFLAMTAVGTIVGNVVGGRLADSGSQPRLFGLGQFISGLFALAFFVSSPGLVASVLLGATFGLATAASRPSIIAMASALSAEHRGTALGIFSFTNQAGWTAGPAIASVGFALAGYPAVGLISGLAATGAAVAMLPLLRADQRERVVAGSPANR